MVVAALRLAQFVLAKKLLFERYEAAHRVPERLPGRSPLRLFLAITEAVVAGGTAREQLTGLRQ